MNSLSPSFHQTFSPEREYLFRLISLIQKQDITKLSIQDISELTDIPNGKDSGKVDPTLKYAQLMGLLKPKEQGYALTSFGATVFQNDMMFMECITQWVMHAFLCDAETGAPVWNKVFSSWKVGEKRSKMELVASSEIPRKIFAPTLQMYLRDACFKASRIVVEADKGFFQRQVAPLNRETSPGFGALLLHLWNEYYPQKEQISLTEFAQTTQFPNKLGWNGDQLLDAIQNLSSMGYVKICSLTQPLIIQPVMQEQKAWMTMYENLL